MNSLAISCGDVNGIGPEIIIKTLSLLQNKIQDEIILIIPENILDEISALIKPQFTYQLFDETSKRSNGIKVLFTENVQLKRGYPTVDSGLAAYNSLDKALQLIESQRASAIVTAPVSKEAFAFAGVKYKGHTDLLAERAGVKDYMMTFISPNFKTGLVTVHIPISEVDKLISYDLLKSKLKVAVNFLENDFSIKHPKIALLGLNPHAGENGNIGNKEHEIILPVMQELNNIYGELFEGPFVPDAFFATKSYLDFDFVVGMYHDQVLIPFKMINFTNGVNFTAGLPYVRTSPDHGTAFDIAWKGVADESSFNEALELAFKILNLRNEKS